MRNNRLPVCMALSDTAAEAAPGRIESRAANINIQTAVDLRFDLNIPVLLLVLGSLQQVKTPERGRWHGNAPTECGKL
jgi:hypothetical protein